MNGSRIPVVAALLMVAMISGGCGGIWWPRKVLDSTAVQRYNFEMVPDAKLVLEDTTPDQRGRWGFRKPGTNQLLVITRITSLARDRDGAAVTRFDKFVERMWIVVPVGAPMGSALVLENLEQQYLTGYDVNIGGNGYYRYPSRLTGKLTLLERKANTITVKIDALVAPTDMANWFINEELEIPVTETGIYATLVPEENVFHPQSVYTPIVPYEPQIDLSVTTDVEGAGGQGDAAEGSVLPNGDANLAAGGEDQGSAPTPIPALDRSIVGQWLATTPPSKRNLSYRVHFQFNDDGTFVHSTGRGGGSGSGYAPGMKYGTYEVKTGFLILDVHKFVFQTENIDHMPSRGMTMLHRIDWEGDKLVLTGDYKHPMGEPDRMGKNLEIKFDLAQFPDLRRFRPKYNLEPGYDPVPEPKQEEIIRARSRKKK